MIYIAQCINELNKIVFRDTCNLVILPVVETAMAFFSAYNYMLIMLNNNNCSLKNH